MAWNDLKEEDQKAINELDKFVRGASMALAQLGNKGRAIASAYKGVETLLSALEDQEVIPTTSGLAGVQSFTKSELIALVQALIKISEPGEVKEGSYNSDTQRAVYAKAAGVVNLIG